MSHSHAVIGLFKILRSLSLLHSFLQSLASCEFRHFLRLSLDHVAGLWVAGLPCCPYSELNDCYQEGFYSISGSRRCLKAATQCKVQVDPGGKLCVVQPDDLRLRGNLHPLEPLSVSSDENNRILISRLGLSITSRTGTWAWP